MTLLVILGAGASYDACDPDVVARASDAWRPPLASELFGGRQSFVEVIREQLPRAIPAAIHLRQRLKEGASVEEELAAMIDRSAAYPPGAVEVAAIRWYLQEIISRCSDAVRSVALTNFVSLVRQIDEWAWISRERVLYVTFNYDTLLEHAVSVVTGHEILGLADYLREPRAPIVKLHGSIDWWHPTREPLEIDEFVYYRRRVIDATPDLTVLPDFLWAVPGSWRLETPAPDGLHEVRVPALAIPIARKDGFECPSEHVAHLEAFLPSVTHILTIGWRAAEDDFLGLIATVTGQPLGLAATASIAGAAQTRTRIGERVTTRWRPDVTNETPGNSSGAFSKLVADGHLRGFLYKHTG